MTNPEDRLQALLNEDKAAWEEFYKDIERRVKRLRRRFFHLTEEDIEDLLQDVFVRLWAKLDTIRNAETLEGWMLTVAARIVIDGLRRLRRRGVELDLDQIDTVVL